MEQQSVLTNPIPGVHRVHTGIGGAQDGQESDCASRISDSLSQASELGDLREPGGYLMRQVGSQNRPAIKDCDKLCYNQKIKHKRTQRSMSATGLFIF